MATKYMHLIDGKPAAFDVENGYIFYRDHYRPAQPLAGSLRQIRREQKIDIEGRKKILGDNYEAADLGYVFIKV